MSATEINREPAVVAGNAPEADDVTGADSPAALRCPRNFLENRFVYLYVSSRTEGLAIGVNMNPDGGCNFNCAYCEVDRTKTVGGVLDVERLAGELRATLEFVHAGRMQTLACFSALPAELRKLRQVSLSGDGEPTLSPVFCEAVETVVHLRAICGMPFFKLVLVTNASAFDRPRVQEGLRQLTRQDEIWAKLDVGTQAGFERVNRGSDRLDHVLANVLLVARERPVVIQTLFANIDGVIPTPAEIAEYVERLRELQQGRAQISGVQIYSASRPTPKAGCGHLPLRTLSTIAQQVRAATGLRVTVY